MPRGLCAILGFLAGLRPGSLLGAEGMFFVCALVAQ